MIMGLFPTIKKKKSTSKIFIPLSNKMFMHEMLGYPKTVT